MLPGDISLSHQERCDDRSGAAGQEDPTEIGSGPSEIVLYQERKQDFSRADECQEEDRRSADGAPKPRLAFDEDQTFFDLGERRGSICRRPLARTTGHQGNGDYREDEAPTVHKQGGAGTERPDQQSSYRWTEHPEGQWPHELIEGIRFEEYIFGDHLRDDGRECRHEEAVADPVDGGEDDEMGYLKVTGHRQVPHEADARSPQHICSDHHEAAIHPVGQNPGEEEAHDHGGGPCGEHKRQSTWTI